MDNAQIYSYESYLSAASASKRSRVDLLEPVRNSPVPSSVVLIRQLLPGVTENIVVLSVGQLGHIADVLMMPQKHIALVQFEDAEKARRLVEMSQSDEGFSICGRRVCVNFSISYEITRPREFQVRQGVRAPSKVLLFTVYNTQYPVTIEVIHMICSPHAKVLRIVMLRKTSTPKVLVEFDDVNNARRAKRFLNGADIYSNCCSLKVEHAAQDSLTVNRNDMDSWDYTFDNLRSMPATMPPPLLSQPQAAGPNAMLPPGLQAPLEVEPPPGQPDNNTNQSVVAADAFNQLSGTSGPAVSDSTGSVVFVLHLPDGRFNCDMLFNLCCVYGNVHRVKFLRNHEGAALVQMSDAGAAERVIKHLTGCVMFGKRIEIKRSKHPSVTEFGDFLLHDKSQSFKDFTASKNNRFSSAVKTAMNRIIAPNATLYFYNCPPTIREETLAYVFEQLGAPRPSRVVKFETRADRASMGLLAFDSVSAACEALAIANHYDIETADSKYQHKTKPAESKFVYTMKLAFTESEMYPRHCPKEVGIVNPQQAILVVNGQQPLSSPFTEAVAESPLPLASAAQVEISSRSATTNLFNALLSYESVASLLGTIHPACSMPFLEMAPGPIAHFAYPVFK